MILSAAFHIFGFLLKSSVSWSLTLGKIIQEE